jgi:D-lactate dehydrogenase (cytochrome)
MTGRSADRGRTLVSQALIDRFGTRASTASSVLDHHSHDESWHFATRPDIVVYPETTDEVRAIVGLARDHRVPIVPFGAGTSMEGNCNPVRGGVSIDTSRMDAILSIDPDNRDCRVQAGVRRTHLNEMVRDTGLFFPVDPGADASIGGMAATRASGTMTLLHGSMRDLVTGLTVVLGTGDVVQTGGRVRKSSSGYDLTRLLIGSEGTLGVITEVGLWLKPIPSASVAGLFAFDHTSDLVECVHDVTALGLSLARLEFMDPLEVRILNAYSKTSFPEKPTLLMELQGDDNRVQSDFAVLLEIAAPVSTLVHKAITQEQKNALWKLRHDIAYAEKQYRPGADLFVTDVAVPLSNLATLVESVRRHAADTGILAPIVGHIGDGNIHVTLLIDRSSDAEVEAAERFHDWIIGEALRLEGTITGEHGVGMGKRKYLAIEHGISVSVMRGIKAKLDPLDLMNPGKIFPDDYA